MIVLGCLVLYASLAVVVFFLMIRRPPRSTLDRSSAASDVYKRQPLGWWSGAVVASVVTGYALVTRANLMRRLTGVAAAQYLSLIHISEPTRPY